VHDVVFPGRDHAAPGSGTIDFASLKPMVKEEHIKVFELSPRLTAEEAAGGVAFVKQVWGAE
jgi:sugar phosphate isomerase/epimerase